MCVCSWWLVVMGKWASGHFPLNAMAPKFYIVVDRHGTRGKRVWLDWHYYYLIQGIEGMRGKVPREGELESEPEPDSIKQREETSCIPLISFLLFTLHSLILSISRQCV